MNQPFLYDPKGNVLRQRAEKPPPVSPTFLNAKPGDWYQYESRFADYQKHIASLPAYTPVSGWVPEVGKEYYPGVHFKIDTVVPDEWGPTYNNPDDPPTILVAVPIEQKQEEPKRLSEQVKKFKYSIKITYRGGSLTTAMLFDEEQEDSEIEGYVEDFCYNNSIGRQDGYRAYWDKPEIVFVDPPPRVFTLADMIECWEAGSVNGFDNAVRDIQGESVYSPNKSQFFKSKHNININD